MHPICWVPENSTSLLDVGCNVGALLSYCRELLPCLHIAGIDINEAALETARARLPGADLRIGSAEELPFADSSFDCVTCIEALEHIPLKLRPQALAEMRRVLRLGGRLVLRVPHAGMFACLDPGNFRFRFPAIYKLFVGVGERDKGYALGSKDVVWHHHFSRDELVALAGDGWGLEVCRYGGLFLLPVLEIASWPLYRMQRTNNVLFRAIQRVKNFDIGCDYGPASYDILLVLQRK